MAVCCITVPTVSTCLVQSLQTLTCWYRLVKTNATLPATQTASQPLYCLFNLHTSLLAETFHPQTTPPPPNNPPQTNINPPHAKTSGSLYSLTYISSSLSLPPCCLTYLSFFSLSFVSAPTRHLATTQEATYANLFSSFLRFLNFKVPLNLQSLVSRPLYSHSCHQEQHSTCVHV